MLTEKENYLMTLRGEQPEWITRYTFGPMPGMTAPPANHVFSLPLPGDQRGKNGGKDIWGVNHVPTESAGGAMIPDNSEFILPLDKLTKWRDIIKAPDYSDVNWDKLVNDQITNSGIDRIQTALALNLHVGYFQTLVAFMGFEDGLIAFYEEPEEVHALLEYLSEFYIGIADKVIDIYKPDVLGFTDDTAAWGTPFISAEMYREFIMPHHEKWARRGRDRGLFMLMHNCGKCENAVDMFLEMGICAWDPAQTCNDLDGIQRRYGNRFVICGGWDGRGRLMDPDVTEEELRQSVRDTMDKYAVGGGFCWCGGFLVAVGDDESAKKNSIIHDEVKKYGHEFYKTH
jgi:hypothetical protein